MRTFVLFLSAACVLMATSVHIYAQTQPKTNMPASVYFYRTPKPTTFDIYTSKTGPTVLQDLKLSSGGLTMNSNKIYVAGTIYIDLDPGSYGQWRLVVYTQNSTGATSLIGPYNTELRWKWRNEVVNGYDETLIGQEIIREVFYGATFPFYMDPQYKYFLHLGASQSFGEFTQDNKNYATIVSYMTDFDFSGRIQLQFGVDLGSTNTEGIYQNSLVFEVYVP
ncbi:MAG: hypothetical protein RBU23_02580 [Candidatus Auribacterota bacterium]|jgi:hypothetical protein|nr:hypothetical protein [Candidatus Auribacterota bacterium]